VTDCPHIDRPTGEIRGKVCPLEVVWGWQGIAELLGDVSVDTARRWERKYGLPVRRLGEDDQGPVYILVKECREWLGACQKRGD